MPASHLSIFFTGRMLFPSPNQQYQTTEGMAMNNELPAIYSLKENEHYTDNTGKLSATNKPIICSCCRPSSEAATLESVTIDSESTAATSAAIDWTVSVDFTAVGCLDTSSSDGCDFCFLP